MLNRDWVEGIKSKLPELPEARRDRFVAEYGLPLYDANLLTGSKAMANYFEACLKTETPQSLPLARRAKTVSNWLLDEFSRLLNATNTEISDSRVSPEQLCQLLNLIQKGSISGTSAKLVLEEMFNTGGDAADIITQRGLSQISDAGELDRIASQVIESNPSTASDYRAGKTQALRFLVGQAMKATAGRADPKLASKLLREKLEEG